MWILVYNNRLLHNFQNIFLAQYHFIVYPAGVWQPTERLSPVFPALPERSAGGRGQRCARPVTTVQHLPALLHTRTETSAATTAAGAAAAAATASAAAATTTLSGMKKLCSENTITSTAIIM
jgi:hypothetical protein